MIPLQDLQFATGKLSGIVLTITTTVRPIIMHGTIWLHNTKIGTIHAPNDFGCFLSTWLTTLLNSQRPSDISVYRSDCLSTLHIQVWSTLYMMATWCLQLTFQINSCYSCWWNKGKIVAGGGCNNTSPQGSAFRSPTLRDRPVECNIFQADNV